MDTIRNTIHQYLDKGYTCIFPNETVARFWLADYASRSPIGAIRSDRALSWDTFHQYFLPVRKDQRPVSSLLRQLFVSRLLEDMRAGRGASGTNEARESLLWFAPVSHPEADERFSRSIAAILPQLAAVDDQLLVQLPVAMGHDLRLLKDAYASFLLERNLFEPAYESPSLDYAAQTVQNQGPYCVMFSKSVPDCDTFLSQLGSPRWIVTHDVDADNEGRDDVGDDIGDDVGDDVSGGGRVGVSDRLADAPTTDTTDVAPTASGDDGPCLEVFENQLQELRTQLRRIEALLEQGVPTRDIVVTCAGLEDFQDILQEEARLHEVPIRIVQGLSPARYPAGRFFNSLKRVYDEHASLDSMKSLLLDPCYPWRDPPLHRRLIAKAVELRIDHGEMTGSRSRDQWHVRLRRIDAGLAQWYDDFKEGVRDICTSSSVQMLRMQLNQFQDRFFIDEQWNRILDPIEDAESASMARINPDADVYSFCMKRIDQLDDALATGGFPECPGLFGIFLRMLETAKYVPQQEQRGIPVYAWPLTAGMSPRYHFVLNMSHDAVQVVQSRADFIPETIGDATLRGERDLTPAVLALYRQTDSLQDGLYLSCSRQTYTDIVLPPSWFVEHGRLRSPDRDIGQVPDLFRSEELLWAGDEPWTAVCTHENQKRWFEQALQGILAPVSKNHDMARSPVGDIRILRPLYTTVQGKALLPLSATSLDLFESCPFAWVCKYLYGVDEQEFTVPPVDHRAIGNLIHSVYHRFFQEAAERYGVYDPDRIDSYRGMLDDIWKDELERLSKRPDAPSASTTAWIRYSLENQLPAILLAEAGTFPDTLSWGYEYKLEETDLERGYRLEGRIDRIILLLSADGSAPSPRNAVESNGAMFAVVDYKKGTAISAKLFNTRLDGGTIESCQLPVYRRLVRSRLGATVSTGAYYSVKDCKYSVVWTVDDGRTARMDDLLDEQISNLLRAVEQGNLSATPSKKSCANCIYRQVCRRRFAIQ